MRVCLISEGSYPYIHGGVSSWMHQFIQSMPDIEFVLVCVVASKKDKGNFKYIMPDNVVEIHEIFLDNSIDSKVRFKKRIKLTAEERDEFLHLLKGENITWKVLWMFFQKKGVTPECFLRSREFMKIYMEFYNKNAPLYAFSSLFHTIRSIWLPVFYILSQSMPAADLYHATATGYSGLLASIGKWQHQAGMIITEHGIYTREREEELLYAQWIKKEFVYYWIRMFYQISGCAYCYADRVTALFKEANIIQEEIGCLKEKLCYIANGIDYDKFAKIPVKEYNSLEIVIGAIVRIAKIKDIKTMIYAFAEAKIQYPYLHLYILGDINDKEYFKECQNLIYYLQVEDIIFTGMVNIEEYMQKFDFTILTSISEGQPLSVLESMAAGKPCICTDVGCCRELLYGAEEDNLGKAGICISPMDIKSAAKAIVTLSKNQKLCEKMGQIGRERVKSKYTDIYSILQYRKLYRKVYYGRYRN